ncbi:MAG: serine hydrolase, partial [Oscillospiraceae bacterium]|nr:serine hydrolase [Oscillospiraceae bacterium]
RVSEESELEVCIKVVDLTTGVEAAFQSDHRMPAASMIKLLIAETFLQQVSHGMHSLDDMYTLREYDIVGGAGSLSLRGAGTQVSKSDLLQKMITESDNVAANVLLDLCGMDAVNREAERLGLRETILDRHFMDTNAMEQGHDNYTCADDIAILLSMIYEKSFVNEKMSNLMLSCLEAQKDNEGISNGLPQNIIFAHKTGTLRTVHHDGGIVEAEKPFIIVVLCGGERFRNDAALEVMRKIGETVYQDLQMPAKAGV